MPPEKTEQNLGQELDNKVIVNRNIPEEEIQNKLIQCIVSLFIFEDALKLQNGKNKSSNTNLSIHLIDKEWLNEFKNKYNFKSINSALFLSNSDFINRRVYMNYKTLINEIFPLNGNNLKLMQPVKETTEKYYINKNNGSLEFQYFDNYGFLDNDSFVLFKNFFGYENNNETNNENKNCDVHLNIYENNVFIISHDILTIEIFKLDDNNDNMVERYLIKIIKIDNYNTIDNYIKLFKKIFIYLV